MNSVFFDLFEWFPRKPGPCCAGANRRGARSVVYSEVASHVACMIGNSVVYIAPGGLTERFAHDLGKLRKRKRKAGVLHRFMVIPPACAVHSIEGDSKVLRDKVERRDAHRAVLAHTQATALTAAASTSFAARSRQRERDDCGGWRRRMGRVGG